MDSPGTGVVRSQPVRWGVDIAPWKIEYGQQDSGVPLPPGTEEGQVPSMKG